MDKDTCDSIARSNGILTSQITTWNPTVGSSCSSLWLDYVRCSSWCSRVELVTDSSTVYLHIYCRPHAHNYYSQTYDNDQTGQRRGDTYANPDRHDDQLQNLPFRRK
jgi:hypothetical protein